MPKLLKDIAMIIKCRDLKPSATGNPFPYVIRVDDESHALVNTTKPELCRFDDAVTAMRQTAIDGDIIVGPSNVHRIGDDEDEIRSGVMAERGFIIRPIHGSLFYHRYMLWYVHGGGFGLKELRREVGNGSLQVPEYNEENHQKILDAQQVVWDARSALDDAETNYSIAKTDRDAVWSNMAGLNATKPEPKVA